METLLITRRTSYLGKIPQKECKALIKNHNSFFNVHFLINILNPVAMRVFYDVPHVDAYIFL